MGTFNVILQDEFADNGVGPGKLTPGEPVRVVFVERFVHETRAGAKARFQSSRVKCIVRIFCFRLEFRLLGLR